MNQKLTIKWIDYLLLLTTNVAKFHVAFLRLNYHYTKAAVGGEKELGIHCLRMYLISWNYSDNIT